MRLKKTIVFTLTLICSTSFLMAQIIIDGTIKGGHNGLSISNAIVKDSVSGIEVFSDVNGVFSISVQSIPATLSVSAFTYKTQTISALTNAVSIGLEEDPLMLESVVISDYQSQNKLLRSQNAVTIISEPLKKSTVGITGLLQNVPGVFTDGSLGEVYTRVYTRGLSASAEDDIGWYYQSLQEDGLPLTAIQYNYFTPDLFQRTDLMTNRLESIRGGKSGILFQNAPGGAFNFISKSPFLKSTEIKTTVGLLGEGNPYYRLDGYTSFPLSSNSLAASISGFYRHDRGHRNTDYTWNRGGQIRTKVSKAFDKGVLSIQLKYLDDHVNRHTGLAARNWEKPTAAFGQDFNYTALMLPALKSSVDGPNGYDYNSADGIHVKDLSLQSSLDLQLGLWSLDIDAKISQKETDWNTSFANQPLGLESFLPYFLSGGQFPFGAVSFQDVTSGETLAVVNNAGALNAFEGLPPSFEYIQGSLPGDALMGIAPWKKLDQLNESMLQLGLKRTLNKHDLYFGLFASRSSLDYFTNASFAFATFEPEPRLLQATLTTFEGNELSLSDSQGMTNYGGLFFESGAFDISQYAFYANDNFKLTDRLVADLGFRFEHVNHKGDLDVPSSYEQDGGLDGNVLTDFDNGRMVSSGITQSIDFTYDYFSFSGALSYELSPSQNIHARYSNTHKAPELNNYIQNFSGLPINDSGEVQTISQLEASYKIQLDKLGFSLTGFSSGLDNIGVSDFVFDQQTNEIYYAPVQINSTSTNGLEVELYYAINSTFSLTSSQTFQSSQAKNYTVYNTSGSADSSDDFIQDFSGNKLPHTPNFMSRVALSADLRAFSGTLSFQYMGSRFGNAENSFTLPSYSTVGFDLNYTVNNNFLLTVQATNLFNSAGLMNFFGPNEFGSSANAATTEYINSSPNASFVVFPILPRGLYFSASYKL